MTTCRVERGGDVENKIQLSRQKKMLTQKILAEIVGLSERNLQAIESGRLDPRTSNSLKLAKALDSTVEELFPLKSEVTA
jgi:putative transcriptional regulator